MACDLLHPDSVSRYGGGDGISVVASPKTLAAAQETGADIRCDRPFSCASHRRLVQEDGTAMVFAAFGIVSSAYGGTRRGCHPRARGDTRSHPAGSSHHLGRS